MKIRSLAFRVIISVGILWCIYHTLTAPNTVLQIWLASVAAILFWMILVGRDRKEHE